MVASIGVCNVLFKFSCFLGHPNIHVSICVSSTYAKSGTNLPMTINHPEMNA